MRGVSDFASDMAGGYKVGLEMLLYQAPASTSSIALFVVLSVMYFRVLLYVVSACLVLFLVI